MKILLPLSLLLMAGMAAAATIQVMNLDDMTADSSAVVQCRIVSSRVEWNDSARNLAVRIYTVKADRYLKGNLGGNFELMEYGGTMNGVTTSTAGVPVFHAGEELVLFVWTDGVRHRHQAIGFEQGAFRIARDQATGAAVVSHQQPISGGGQVIDSDRLNSTLQTIRADARTSRDLNQFLTQVGESVRRVSARQKAVRP